MNAITTAAKKAKKIAGAETIRIMKKVLFIIQSKFFKFSPNIFTVHNVYLGGIPLNLSDRLHELINNLATDAKLSKPLPERHSSSFSTYEFLCAINEDTFNETRQLLRSQDAFSIHIDESTDIVQEKHLMVYATIFDSKQQVSRTIFVALLKLERTKAVDIAEKLTSFFVKNRISLKQITSFTSDGASVMLGCKNGVVTLLREKYGLPNLIEFHCIAHREALAVKDVLNVRYIFLIFQYS